ncbi:MAG: hypothetical protein KJO98_06225 [Rhodothermia bacterium]|nr:hypothetical protein [Rhodothermia bacterium]
MRLSAMSFVRPTLRQLTALVFLGSSAFLMACTTTRNAEVAADSEIVIEGMVSVRGNEPFTGIVLVTGDRNSYVLSLESEEAASSMRRQAPARFRVSGVPYKDLWQGTHRAHLQVTSWERLDL